MFCKIEAHIVWNIPGQNFSRVMCSLQNDSQPQFREQQNCWFPPCMQDCAHVPTPVPILEFIS